MENKLPLSVSLSILLLIFLLSFLFLSVPASAQEAVTQAQADDQTPAADQIQNQSGNIPQGDFSLLKIAPKGYEFIEPEIVSKETAAQALIQAQKDINELKALNFITLFSADVKAEAQRAYDKGDYLQVFRLTQLISYVKREKLDYWDKVKLLEIRKQAAQERGVGSISEVNNLQQQSINAFSLEQFDEADSLLQQANEALNKATKESARVKLLALIGRNFFLRYWWENLLAMLVLVFFAPLIINKITKSILKSKIFKLKIEIDKTKELIQKLQKECFVERTITVKTYHERAAKYEERIGEIKQILPVLEEQLRIKEQQKNFWFVLLGNLRKSRKNMKEIKKISPQTETGPKEINKIKNKKRKNK